MAATKDAVLERRAEYFDEYVHTPQVTLEPKRKTAVVLVPAAQRARRNSAPTTFSLNERRRGLPPGGGRAGPGRGHIFEHIPHGPVESPLLPPLGALVANWLTQHTLRKQWETPRIKQLERELDESAALNVAQAKTIVAQRAELKHFEDCLWQAGQSIVSGLDMGDPLSQASHAAELVAQEGWDKVIGVGYSDTLKRDLIYRHLAKLLESLRKVTGADPIRAKQLVDLLHARVHAGEARHMSAASLAEQREQQLCAAVTGSLAEFVSGLYAAGGAGRYPDKVTKSMQVIATAVSNAVAKHGVSYKEIRERLGLVPELIGKCKASFNQLVDDCEWEQLFDDHRAVRCDTLPDKWKAHGLQFWTDAELLDPAGQLYGFVRYSERAKDQIRDPANRTSKETFRIAWLEARVRDVYAAMKGAGEATWPDFHMSLTVFSGLRPFYVKDVTRETCMCIYHMRWVELCSGGAAYRHKLREH